MFTNYALISIVVLGALSSASSVATIGVGIILLCAVAPLLVGGVPQPKTLSNR